MASFYDENYKQLYTSIELIYFNIPGRAEPIRLACYYAGIPLKDTRLTREEFMIMKTDGSLPYGQVPLLVVNNSHRIGQSMSIIRFIGKISGLYPTDPISAALVDSIMDESEDMVSGIAASKYRERYGFGCLTDETVASIRKAINDEVLPRFLSFFERILTESTTGWLANTESPSIADFHVLQHLQSLTSGATDGISRDILEGFPKTKALVDRFMALDAVVSYYSSTKV